MSQMRGILLAMALFFFAAPLFVYSQSFGVANFSSTYANATIANATAYINNINQSTYLIFSPHLEQAYAYLNTSESLAQNSPTQAVYYAGLAVDSAKTEYSRIGLWRGLSFTILTLFTAGMAFLLWTFMRPVKKNKN